MFSSTSTSTSTSSSSSSSSSSSTNPANDSGKKRVFSRPERASKKRKEVAAVEAIILPTEAVRKLANMTAEIERLKELIKILRSSNTGLAKKFTACEAALNSNKERLKESKDNENHSRLAYLAVDRELAQTKRILESERVSLKRKSDELCIELNNAKQQITNLIQSSNAYVDVTSQLRTLQTYYNDLHNQWSTMQSCYVDLQTQLKAQQDRNNMLRTWQEEQQTSSEGILRLNSTLQTELRDQLASNSSLRTQLAGQQTSNRTLQTQLAELQAKFQVLEDRQAGIDGLTKLCQPVVTAPQTVANFNNSTNFFVMSSIPPQAAPSAVKMSSNSAFTATYSSPTNGYRK